MVRLASPVMAEMVCGVCGSEIGLDDAAICVVGFPKMVSHMICVQDYAIIMSSAYAWLKENGEATGEAPGDAVRRAARIFLGDHDLSDLSDAP